MPPKKDNEGYVPIGSGFKRRISREEMMDLLKPSEAPARNQPSLPKTVKPAAPSPSVVKPRPKAQHRLTPDDALLALVMLLDTPSKQNAFGQLVKQKLLAAGLPSYAEAARRLGYRSRGIFYNALAGRHWQPPHNDGALPRGWTPYAMQNLLELAGWPAIEALAEMEHALNERESD